MRTSHCLVGKAWDFGPGYYATLTDVSPLRVVGMIISKTVHAGNTLEKLKC